MGLNGLRPRVLARLVCIRWGHWRMRHGRLSIGIADALFLTRDLVQGQLSLENQAQIAR